MWYRDSRGRLTPEDEALLDEWGYPRGDPVVRLIVRWAGGNARPIDDYEISRLLPFELTVAGVAKHYRDEVEVTVSLTPSRIPEITASLGGSQRFAPYLTPSYTGTSACWKLDSGSGVVSREELGPNRAQIGFLKPVGIGGWP